MKSRSKIFLLVLFILFLLIYILFGSYLAFILWVQLLFISISILALYLGGELFFDETYTLSSRFSGHSEKFNSAVLSLGSIIDEIALVTVATFERRGSISLGAILGSNSVIIVAFVILALMSNKRKQSWHFTLVTVYIVLIGVVLLSSAYIFHSLFWVGSLFLLLIFIVFFFTPSSSSEPDETVNMNETFSPLLFLISIFSIGISSYVIVEIIQNVASIFSIGVLLSSVVIAGIAGSLPEVYLMKLSFNRGKDSLASSILNSSTVYKTAFLLPLAAMVVPIMEGGSEIVAILAFLILSVAQLIITRK